MSHFLTKPEVLVALIHFTRLLDFLQTGSNRTFLLVSRIRQALCWWGLHDCRLLTSTRVCRLVFTYRIYDDSCLVDVLDIEFLSDGAYPRCLEKCRGLDLA